MNVLGKNTDAVIKTLMSRCVRLRWAVAWASAGFPLFDVLKCNEHKIAQFVIGTHFYQTHPEFIGAFLHNERVRFMMQPNGVFHPKLYLFEHQDKSWDCIIGSANFTGAAFSKNAEVSVHISSKDADGRQAYCDVDSLLNDLFSAACVIDDARLMQYREVWRRQQSLVSRLSGTYSELHSTPPNVSPLDVSVFTMSWNDYFNKVTNDSTHTTDGRLLVLKEAERLFSDHRRFAEIPYEGRRGIAGFGKHPAIEWGWFGSMQGHGYFKQAIGQDCSEISRALDEIPLTGEVSARHFERYLSILLSAFPKPGIGTVTRLLCMKRPDYFVCLDDKNIAGLCTAFGIAKQVAPGEYWNKVVARIIDSNWWNAPEPTERSEKDIWKRRAAFLDVLYYSEISE